MPGSAGGRGRNPWHLTVVELLLQGHPGEFLPEWSEHQGGGVDHARGTSDRELMTEAARRWSTNLTLTGDERDRIRVVWLDGTYRPPVNLDTARRDALRGALHRTVA